MTSNADRLVPHTGMDALFASRHEPFIPDTSRFARGSESTRALGGLAHIRSPRRAYPDGVHTPIADMGDEPTETSDLGARISSLREALE